jgi:hypothetical protein
LAENHRDQAGFKKLGRGGEITQQDRQRNKVQKKNIDKIGKIEIAPESKALYVISTLNGHY